MFTLYGIRTAKLHFRLLKSNLCQALFWLFPEQDGNYILFTDASDIEVGAVSAQEDVEGKEKVISYASIAFSGTERN